MASVFQCDRLELFPAGRVFVFHDAAVFLYGMQGRIESRVVFLFQRLNFILIH